MDTDLTKIKTARHGRSTCPLWTRLVIRTLSVLLLLASLTLFICATRKGVNGSTPAHVICPVMIIIDIWCVLWDRKILKGWKTSGRRNSCISAAIDFFQCALAVAAGLVTLTLGGVEYESYYDEVLCDKDPRSVECQSAIKHQYRRGNEGMWLTELGVILLYIVAGLHFLSLIVTFTECGSLPRRGDKDAA
ncbi:hypothetical protein B0T16DRAFT_461861 [Cercophora newfieldiana]|uniref:Uncharacterized protein n=1 Tax=Cercophora newfieldiana TaxID=92897 RepID=A0AA39XYU8_9PEZI|nr:hypothetical protein B0T16DRAFT_461861 [Cercophora newfieldiana]